MSSPHLPPHPDSNDRIILYLATRGRCHSTVNKLLHLLKQPLVEQLKYLLYVTKRTGAVGLCFLCDTQTPLLVLFSVVRSLELQLHLPTPKSDRSTAHNHLFFGWILNSRASSSVPAHRGSSLPHWGFAGSQLMNRELKNSSLLQLLYFGIELLTKRLFVFFLSNWSYEWFIGFIYSKCLKEQWSMKV